MHSNLLKWNYINTSGFDLTSFYRVGAKEIMYDVWFQVFFVLRKKDSHVTFLHVYHHVNMVITTWTFVRFIKGEINNLLNRCTSMCSIRVFFSIGNTVSWINFWRNRIKTSPGTIWTTEGQVDPVGNLDQNVAFMNFPPRKSNFEFQMITRNEISIKNRNINSVRRFIEIVCVWGDILWIRVLSGWNIYTIGRTTTIL